MNGNSSFNSIFSTDVQGGFFSQFLNKELLKKKVKVSALHFVLSTLLISSFFLFSIIQWFPHSSLELSGIKNILYIIIGADLILGPALTFLVFNPTKKSLKFDLCAILALQLSMFVYGMFTVYSAHPVYITFNIDRFTLVSARDATPDKAKFDEYKVPKYSKTVYAYVEPPKTIKERNDLLFSSSFGGLDLDALSQYYLPYEKNINNIVSMKWDIDNVFATDKQKIQLSSFLQNNEIKLNDLVFLPVQGKTKFMTYAINKKTGKPVEVFDIDPWENNKPNNKDSLTTITKKELPNEK